MPCLEIWINERRIALVGHAEAEVVQATVEATRGIDQVVLEATAQLNDRRGNITYATWGTHLAAVGDELRIRVDNSQDPDVGTIVVQGEGEEHDAHGRDEWPLCSFCGRSYHDAHSMIAGRRGYICDSCLDDLIELRASGA